MNGTLSGTQIRVRFGFWSAPISILAFYVHVRERSRVCIPDVHPATRAMENSDRLEADGGGCVWEAVFVHPFRAAIYACVRGPNGFGCNVLQHSKQTRWRCSSCCK